jgi:hypothetical protein
VNDTPELPGHELVTNGLSDLQQGRETVESLLVEMAAPRLRALGYEVPTRFGTGASHRLFELLSQREGAHSQYNALVGRIVSFARAAEHASTH